MNNKLTTQKSILIGSFMIAGSILYTNGFNFSIIPEAKADYHWEDSVSSIVEGYGYQTSSDVESIVEGYDYKTRSQIKSIVESCYVYDGEYISC